MASWDDFPIVKEASEWDQFPLAEVGPVDSGQGYGSSLLGSAARGFTSFVPGAIGGLGYLTGSEELVETGEDIESSLEQFFPVNPVYQDDFAMKAAGAVGQAGSMLLTGGAGGAVGKVLGGVNAINRGAQTAALGSGFLSGAREGGQTAERYGMEGGNAYLRTLLGGATELASEKLLFGMGTELGGVRKVLGDTLEKGAGGFAKAVGTEAGEEAAAQVAGNLETKLLAPEGVQTPGVTEGVLEAAALGGVGGGVFGGVNLLTGAQDEQQTVESGQSAIPPELQAKPKQPRFKPITIPGISEAEYDARLLSPDAIRGLDERAIQDAIKVGAIRAKAPDPVSAEVQQAEANVQAAAPIAPQLAEAMAEESIVTLPTPEVTTTSQVPASAESVLPPAAESPPIEGQPYEETKSTLISEPTVEPQPVTAQEAEVISESLPKPTDDTQTTTQSRAGVVPSVPTVSKEFSKGTSTNPTRNTTSNSQTDDQPDIERKPVDATFEKLIALKGVTKHANGLYQLPANLWTPDRRLKLKGLPRDQQSLRFRVTTIGEVRGDFNSPDSKDIAILDESVRGARAPRAAQTPTTDETAPPPSPAAPVQPTEPPTEPETALIKSSPAGKIATTDEPTVSEVAPDETAPQETPAHAVEPVSAEQTGEAEAVELDVPFLEGLAKKYGSPVPPSVPAQGELENLSRASNMLEKAARDSNEPEEITKILQAGKGLPYEARVAVNVAQNPITDSATFEAALQNPALQAVVTPKWVESARTRRADLRTRRGLETEALPSAGQSEGEGGQSIQAEPAEGSIPAVAATESAPTVVESSVEAEPAPQVTIHYLKGGKIATKQQAATKKNLIALRKHVAAYKQVLNCLNS